MSDSPRHSRWSSSDRLADCENEAPYTADTTEAEDEPSPSGGSGAASCPNAGNRAGGRTGNPVDTPGAMDWDRFKADILADFAQWLDGLDAVELDAMRNDGAGPAQGPDLFSLYGELGALRQDVRLHAKASQALRDQVQEVAGALQDGPRGNTPDLDQALAVPTDRTDTTVREAQTAVARELVATREGLLRCLETMAEVRLKKPGRRRQRKLLIRLRRPLELLLRKMENSLARLKIRPVAQIGGAFDAKLMRVVGITKGSGSAPGTVTGICRQGYLLDGKTFQTAEVEVERES